MQKLIDDGKVRFKSVGKNDKVLLLMYFCLTAVHNNKLVSPPLHNNKLGVLVSCVFLQFIMNSSDKSAKEGRVSKLQTEAKRWS